MVVPIQALGHFWTWILAASSYTETHGAPRDGMNDGEAPIAALVVT